MNHYLPLTDTIAESTGTEWAILLSDPLTNEPNTSLIGTFQFAWDSVSLGALKKCPRYYNFTILEGWHQKVTSPPLIWGIAYHKCLETWHKLLALGIDKQTALERTTRLAGLLGETVTPGDTARTKETLLRSVIWYLTQFENDRAETTIQKNGAPAVEYSFQIPLFDLEGQEIYFCGHIDRLATFNDELYVTDLKSTKMALDQRFAKEFKPNQQIAGYVTAAHIMAETVHAIPSKPAGAIIDAVQIGVNFSRFARFIIPFSEHEVNEYILGFEAWVKQARKFSEENYWPANEISCGQYGGCTFRDICTRPPSERPRMLEANFRKATWDPRKSR